MNPLQADELVRDLGAGVRSDGGAAPGAAQESDGLQQAVQYSVGVTATASRGGGDQMSPINIILMGLGVILLLYIGSGVWGLARSVQKLTEIFEASQKQGGGQGAASIAAKLVKKHLQDAAVGGKSEL